MLLKVTTGFALQGELVVSLLQVFGRKLILAPNEIPDETCQALAVGVIVPLEIEDWEDGRASNRNPALTKRLASDLGKWGWAQVCLFVCEVRFKDRL